MGKETPIPRVSRVLRILSQSSRPLPAAWVSLGGAGISGMGLQGTPMRCVYREGRKVNEPPLIDLNCVFAGFIDGVTVAGSKPSTVK